MYTGIIYKYTSPDGKIYIGQTRNEKVRRRCWNNLSTPYAGVRLEKARQQFGPDNFTYEVLFKVESENEYDIIDTLNKKEIEYISLYDSCNKGYNGNTGGDCFKMSEESIQKASESKKKAILQYDLDGNFVQEWNSAKDVEQQTGIKACNIALVLKQTRYQTGGYIFKYKMSDSYPLSIEVNHSKTQKQIIIKYTLDGEIINKFDSINDAAKDCGVGRDCLRQYIDGKNNHIYRNFKWKRYE